jgi:DNA-binding PadR family transcriptional regulator
MRHVPTAAELALEGLAREVVVRTGAKSTAKIFRISEEGYRLIREAMAENALEARERGEGSWTRPPNSGRVLPH